MSNQSKELAFPMVVSEGTSEAHEGLTKREWFAGQAFAGRLANGPILENMRETEVPEDVAIKAYARHAVLLADALLAELAKEP